MFDRVYAVHFHDDYMRRHYSTLGSHKNITEGSGRSLPYFITGSETSVHYPDLNLQLVLYDCNWNQISGF